MRLGVWNPCKGLNAACSSCNTPEFTLNRYKFACNDGIWTRVGTGVVGHEEWLRWYSLEKIVVTMYTIRCGITVQMLACPACLCVCYDSYSKQRLFQCTALTDGVILTETVPVYCEVRQWNITSRCSYFRCRTAGWKSVSGRCCDRPPRHRFFLVSLCL